MPQEFWHSMRKLLASSLMTAPEGANCAADLDKPLLTVCKTLENSSTVAVEQPTTDDV